MDIYDLATIAGVAGAATLTTQLVKQSLALTGHWVLLVVVLASAAWTWLAVLQFGTLSGDYLALSLSVLVASLGAVGNYEGLLPLLATLAKALTRSVPALLCVAALGVVGCLPVAADRARHDALVAPVDEYKSSHPEQAQSYTDLMTAWERSIVARERLNKGTK